MICLDRPAPGEYPPYGSGYVARVPEGDLVRILDRQILDTLTLLGGVPRERETHAYVAGKWSIREVVGHLADVERFLACRALRIARGDPTELPGFDENAYVASAGFGRRALGDLMEELRTVRRSTVALLAGLPAEAWIRSGRANGYPWSVRGIATFIAGHELHHRAILEERYLVR